MTRCRKQQRARADLIRELTTDQIRQRIDVNAPVPSYEIDRVVLQLLNEGTLSSMTFGRHQVINVRSMVISAAQHGLCEARERFKHPERLKEAQELLADLARMRVLCRRIRRRDPSIAAVVVCNCFDSEAGDFCDFGGLLIDLQDEVSDIEAQVDHLLDHTYIPKNRGGNHEPLTTDFIDQMMPGLAKLVSPQERSRVTVRRGFVRLFAAAWRDLGFDHHHMSSEPLEEWFADRVRKALKRKPILGTTGEGL